MDKPELLVTARDLNEVEQLITAGANALNIGSEQYGLRVAGDFSLEMIGKATELAHANNVKIYVLMNAILHNEALSDLHEYIAKLAAYGVDAIVFGDPAVFMAVKEVAPNIPLHWNTETASTNYQTVNYWAEKGIARAILARELSLQEVAEIKSKVKIEIQAQIHGKTCIFHSKRELVSSYLQHIGGDSEHTQQGLFLQEHKRPQEKYPIYEDRHGTHIMSEHDLCMINHIEKFIAAGIDSLKIEGLLHNSNYVVNVTKLYRKAIDNVAESPNLLAKIAELQPANSPLGTGFYFKEQYY